MQTQKLSGGAVHAPGPVLLKPTLIQRSLVSPCLPTVSPSPMCVRYMRFRWFKEILVETAVVFVVPCLFIVLHIFQTHSGLNACA